MRCEDWWQVCRLPFSVGLEPGEGGAKYCETGELTIDSSPPIVLVETD